MALITCPDCGKQISDMAQNCPHCGKPMGENLGENGTRPPVYRQNNVPKKKKKGHGCLIFILIFMVIITAIGIGIGSVTSKQTEDIDSDNSTAVIEEESGEINYGEEAAITDGLILKVNEVTETDRISVANGLLAYKPDSGKYAVVNVTIFNNSKNGQDLLLSYFKLIGPDDASYVATLIPSADDKFITVDQINPNLSITGNLVFEIPVDLAAEDCVLKYSDFDLFNEISYFKLK